MYSVFLKKQNWSLHGKGVQKYEEKYFHYLLR